MTMFKLADQKYLTLSQFTRKLLIIKNLRRVSLVAQEVLYKSLIDIALLSLTCHAINRQFIHWAKNFGICGMN